VKLVPYLALLIVAVQLAAAQQPGDSATSPPSDRPPEFKLIALGAGSTFGPDSTAFTFAFALDQPETPNAPSPLEIAAFRCFGSFCHLIPSAQVTLGNGAKSAANNVSVQLPIETWRRLPRRKLLHVAFAPGNLSADREFDTAILYTSFGIDVYVDRYSTLKKIAPTKRWYWRIGARADLGERFNKGPEDNATLTRIVPFTEASFKWKNWLKLSLAGKVFVIQSDPFVGGTHTFALGTVSADIRFAKHGKLYSDGLRPLLPIGLTLKYARGHDEPKYEEQNVLMAGIGLYISLQ
jgi:hypothetical protein